MTSDDTGEILLPNFDPNIYTYEFGDDTDHGTRVQIQCIPMNSEATVQIQVFDGSTWVTVPNDSIIDWNDYAEGEEIPIRVTVTAQSQTSIYEITWKAYVPIP